MSIECLVSARIGRGSAAENKSWNRKPWPPPHQKPTHQITATHHSPRRARSYQAHNRLAAGLLTKHLSPLAAHHRSQSTHRKTPLSSSQQIAISPWNHRFFFSPQLHRYTTNRQVCLQRTTLTLHDIVLPPRLRILFFFLPRPAVPHGGLHLHLFAHP
jgi:hypothetical protein